MVPPPVRPAADGSGTTGPRSKCDQVVFEAIAKACEVIVAARGPEEPPGGGAHALQANSSAEIGRAHV